MLPARAASVAILAFPETTASVVYGRYDLFASAGRDWGFVVSGEPGPELMRPAVVAAAQAPFEAANGVTLLPHAAFDLDDWPAPAERERPVPMCKWLPPIVLYR